MDEVMSLSHFRQAKAWVAEVGEYFGTPQDYAFLKFLTQVITRLSASQGESFDREQLIQAFNLYGYGFDADVVVAFIEDDD
ncbi:hypothetical protein [Paraferrimonas sedimenticola]|uniref:Uncharacterized protein n=1 Tax=Paraferrimonas sedimenticola TaxID=375674 RepID=A0AA37RUF7_9GAMM|nr:hypothetical protein [Paraferrimonas sedimenticola]GLP94702.1 hypothetical protein GCM10007895_00080 [Paraferrimonas sedimenticola]